VAIVLKVLPMAVVIVAEPQIVSAILLATSAQAWRDSIAFLAGATLATTIGVTAAYLLSSSAVASYQGRPERRDRLRDHRAVVDPDGCGFP
jgi:hypothetical protein